MVIARMVDLRRLQCILLVASAVAGERSAQRAQACVRMRVCTGVVKPA